MELDIEVCKSCGWRISPISTSQILCESCIKNGVTLKELGLE